jgi:peptidoglycan/LPS O-acetylase OafA/YrhL
MNSTNLNYNTFSETVSTLRFPLIVLIILLHCYSSVTLSGDHDIYFKSIYPLALWLGETGVPIYFFISGFYFYYSKKSYTQKLITRAHSLLIPYFLWNGMLLTVYIITLIAGFPQEINNKNIIEYSFIDFLRLFWDRGSYDNGNFVPLLCPLWYIRNLIIMSIISPLLYYIIKYVREVFIFFVAVWWMTTPHNAFIPQTILFFSLGAFFSIQDMNPLDTIYRKKWVVLLLFILFAIGDIISHVYIGTSVNLQIHRISLIFNIPALLLLGNRCVRHGYTSKWLPNAAFIVFCVHYPIVVGLRKFCVAQFSEASDIVHIFLYFTCVVISTILSLSIYQVLNQYFPKVKNILSGNR